MHSISTNTSFGSLATSTVERAGLWDNHFSYTAFISGKSSIDLRNTCVSYNVRRRMKTAEMPSYGSFDNLAETGSTCIYYVLKITQCLLSLLLYGLRRDLHEMWIYRDASRYEDETVCLDCLRIWTECSRCI
jgi:hypothetical protein